MGAVRIGEEKENEKTKKKEKAPLSERIIALFLCKGDLSDEKLDAQPCSFSELFRYSTPWERVLFFFGILCALLTGLLMPLNVLLGGLIAGVYLDADEVDPAKARAAILPVIHVYLAAAVVQFVISFLQQHLVLHTTNSLVDRTRREFIAAVLRMGAPSLDRRQPGEMSSLLNDNIEKIRDGLGDKIGLLVRGCGMFIFSIAVSFWYNWKVSLTLLPLGPICAVVMGMTGKYAAASIKQQMEANGEASALIEESIMHVRTVASCNGQQDMVEKYSSILQRGIALGAKVCFINGFFEGLLFFAIYLFALLSLLVGVPDVFSAGGFSGGSVIIAFGCSLFGAYFLGMLGPHMMALLKARVAAAMIYQTIDETTLSISPLQELKATEPRKLRGTIEFSNVHFKYESRPTPILKGLSFSAAGGQSIALVGRSGCGKSTATCLLSKLYKPTSGEISIDGVPIEKLDTIALRSEIGVVSQEPLLFNGSVRENIVLGRKWAGPGTEEERMARVAAIAHATPFIRKLEKGFDTLLGEGGIALSGGQKQRIAIARALFMDPSILILDEATSALDVQSERLVQEALAAATVGRTSISIAHRLSTLKGVDVIYLVEGGVVTERGTHEELVGSGGFYSRLAEEQRLAAGHSSEETTQETSIDDDRIRESCSEVKTGEEEEVIESVRKPTPTTSSSSSFLRLFTHGHGWKILFAFIFSALRGMECPCYCLLMALLYRTLNARSDAYLPHLILTCAVSFAIGVFVWLVLSLAYFFAGWSSESVIARVKTQILQRVLHQEAKFFDTPETSNSSIVTALNQLPSALLAGLDYRFVLLTWTSATFFVCLAATLVLNWRVGLIGLGVTLILDLLLLFLAYLLSNWNERRSRLSGADECSLEILSKVRTVQMMTAEAYFEEKYAREQKNVHGVNGKIILVQSLVWSLCQTSIFVYGLVSFGVGSQLVVDGSMSGDSLFILGTTFEFFGWVLVFFSPVLPDLSKANSAARILYALYDLPERLDVGQVPPLTGQFAVNALSFAYPARPEHKVASSLSLSVDAGEAIALVGPSGGGKSTLIAMLERFYEQTEGSITMDGRDHRALSLAHLRSQIAMVGQEPVLFQGSIASNILLGCSSDLTIEDVREACRIANAADFIESFPAGYDTEVGGGSGGQLSGGQKQRIAIARAIVRQPAILLLDEATSALDAESEKIVQEGIYRSCEGRTSVSIAHRLSSIKNASRIFFIENGSVAESGTYAELMERGAKFAAFAQAQSIH